MRASLQKEKYAFFYLLRGKSKKVKGEINMEEGKTKTEVSTDVNELINGCSDEDKDLLIKLICAFLQLNKFEKITALRLVRLGGMYSSMKCCCRKKKSPSTDKSKCLS